MALTAEQRTQRSIEAKERWANKTPEEKAEHKLKIKEGWRRRKAARENPIYRTFMVEITEKYNVSDKVTTDLINGFLSLNHSDIQGSWEDICLDILKRKNSVKIKDLRLEVDNLSD